MYNTYVYKYNTVSTSTLNNKGIPPNALLFAASEFHASSQPAEGPRGFAIAPAEVREIFAYSETVQDTTSS